MGETEPFIAELLGELTTTIQDLETHQIHMFYEAVGLMISADADNKRRDQYLVSLSTPKFQVTIGVLAGPRASDDFVLKCNDFTIFYLEKSGILPRLIQVAQRVQLLLRK